MSDVILLDLSVQRAFRNAQFFRGFLSSAIVFFQGAFDSGFFDFLHTKQGFLYSLHRSRRFFVNNHSLGRGRRVWGYPQGRRIRVIDCRIAAAFGRYLCQYGCALRQGAKQAVVGHAQVVAPDQFYDQGFELVHIIAHIKQHFVQQFPLLECFAAPLRLLRRHRRRQIAFEQLGHHAAQILDVNCAIFRQNGELFGDVLQLADITRPAIAQKRVFCLFCQFDRINVVFFRKIIGEFAKKR